MNELALFAGAGGGILGGHLLGWRTVCAVEIEPYAIDVLAQRQNDGILSPFPIWDDIRTFDGRPWRGIVDVVSGGFPCQDISVAWKGAGITGERSGLWFEMARIVSEVRPRFVFIENSPMLRTRGLAQVLKDVAEIGYNAEWCVLGADDVGAPHIRKRIWILAYSDRSRELQSQGVEPEQWGWSVNICAEVPHTEKQGLEGPIPAWRPRSDGCFAEHRQGGRHIDWWSAEPYVGRVAHGVAARMDRLKAIGNGQVPAVAATAWNILISRISNQ